MPPNDCGPRRDPGSTLLRRCALACLRGWRNTVGNLIEFLSDPKKTYHRPQLTGISVKSRGAWFHRTRDVKQYYFNSIPPTSHLSALAAPQGLACSEARAKRRRIGPKSRCAGRSAPGLCRFYKCYKCSGAGVQVVHICCYIWFEKSFFPLCACTLGRIRHHDSCHDQD